MGTGHLLLGKAPAGTVCFWMPPCPVETCGALLSLRMPGRSKMVRLFQHLKSFWLAFLRFVRASISPTALRCVQSAAELQECKAKNAIVTIVMSV